MITLACKKCGAPLQVTEQLDLFACQHCGTTHQVDRSGGVVSLRRVEERLDNLQAGIDRQTAELAITRIRGELEGLATELDAAKERCEKAEAEQLRARGGCGCAFVGAVLLGAAAATFSTTEEYGGAVGCSGVVAGLFLLAGIGYLVRFFAFRAGVRAAKAERETLMKSGQAKQAEHDRYYGIVNRP